ncbi:hypothetical protein ACFOY5_16060 [Massilia aurea]|jgi:hypothetical protein|uniref:hypothetical protein n=1 Tax=Massilia aurea TaxID=373040 RepID=UPI00216294BC|nr:hypothetical protein [Massilia aurea]MCS0706272.1 hypothetical protein [Massilia aurea]
MEGDLLAGSVVLPILSNDFRSCQSIHRSPSSPARRARRSDPFLAFLPHGVEHRQPYAPKNQP